MKHFFLFILILVFTSSIIPNNIPDKYQFIFPKPGSKFVNTSSSIILRFNKITPHEIINLDKMITVNGDISGLHTGKTFIASDNKTVIFDHVKNFKSGETIEVIISPKLDKNSLVTIDSFNFKFTVEQKFSPPSNSNNHISQNNHSLKKDNFNNQPTIMPNGVSVPSDFPHVNILNKRNPSKEYIFLNNWGPPNYNIIFDTDGNPVWYWKTNDRRRDFKLQSNDLITMLIRNGYGGYGEGFIALNNNFEYVKTMRTTLGYYTDEHDCFMLPDGGYFLIGKKDTRVDMSQYVAGGRSNATVSETCIQEFTANNELIFIWRAWDHFDIRDLDLESLTSTYIRFPHMNAIFIDEDGHILLSSRHLSEISKINRHTGEFIWRLSGIPNSPNNSFQFINDQLKGFRNQHAITYTGNNKYLIFDNGNMHSPPASRAVEYLVDTTNMTATLVWEYKNDLNNYSYYMGNAQRLPNNNTHINWAVGNTLPIALEVTPEGDKVFEMQFKNGYHCYRSFRHSWNGNCVTPYLLIEPQPDNITLLFNKFGDSNIIYYNIYGGTSPQPTEIIDTSHNTLKQISDLTNGVKYYFRVTAVNKNGNESNFSNEENIIYNVINPGDNLIKNGDFTNGLNNWIWDISGTAEGIGKVEQGHFHYSIESGGNHIYEVQLRQNGIQLIQGESYTFEFDAWADASRIVEVKVGQDSSPFTNYSRIGLSAFSTNSKHFKFEFKMNESTDNNARVVINAGTDNNDIYIDNLSLKMELSTEILDEKKITSRFKLEHNYPNPFNPTTTIKYSIPEAGKVELFVHDILGKEVASIVNENQSAGTYSKKFEAQNLTSGIYFYTIKSGNYVKTNKMLLLK